MHVQVVKVTVVLCVGSEGKWENCQGFASGQIRSGCLFLYSVSLDLLYLVSDLLDARNVHV